ncbi:NUMOD3 domain-containing DNA-binding protein [Borborobacter arsenicus]|nr:NUMOD3 domain-containing DNA-binding protein [Pseudaminobacter arsenicus]
MARIADNDNNPYRFYVYAWCYPGGRPFYVGKGAGERDTSERGRNPIFKRIVAKIRRNGSEPFVARWQDGLCEEDAFRLEVAYIGLLGRRDKGTGILANLTDGGDGPSGAVISDETRAKLSEARRGKNNPMNVPEYREKVAASKRGKPRPPEVHERLLAANLGRPLSVEHRAKLSEASRNMSVEARAKIGAAHRGVKKSQKTRERMTAALRLRPPRSGFKGVHLHKSGRWESGISIDGTQRYLGLYDTAEKAAIAYDSEAYAAYGGNCYLNFPEKFGQSCAADNDNHQDEAVAA